MQFSDSTGRAIPGSIQQVIVAGWTGRDRAAVDHHIEELAALGVAPPSRVPLFYRVSRDLLTTEPVVEVLGTATSGEVEPLVLALDGTLWLGLASDHTDRELEAISVAASKQACPKPVASTLWRLDDVADHVDALELSCQIEENGAWIDYQKGSLANILPLPDLVEKAGLQPGAAMLCGTLPAMGGVRPAQAYRMALNDPIQNRTLTLDYSVRTLPVIA